ncbi:MAG TPA: Trk family potassium uptake protein [Dehalococcoidia bacterium]|nr:Trk family potassium uptake protein [Dehalococcoidia bacterium]
MSQPEWVPTRKPGDRVLRIPRVRSWRVPIPLVAKPRTGGASSLILIYGFAGVIILGTLLLMLPVASKTGQSTSFVDALFTSTSAVCVTGLVVVDTADHWNYFGQGVILTLIQIGGFGFMTSATLFLLMFGRRIGLQERLLIGESMGLARPGGVVRLIRRMAIFTISVEIVGAAVFYVRLSMEDPEGMSLWRSVFQSVSAFNNAGFDVFGGFRSLSGFIEDPLMLLATAVLIILGGISFLVLADLFRTHRFGRLSLDSKLVLSTTVLLLVFGTLVILLTEFADPDTLGGLSLPQKVLNAFFQSVTARTAGFSTISMANLANYALFFTMLLMYIGGAAGSTAGGIKVNTFGMLTATMWSTLRGRERPGVFGRAFNPQQIYRALVVVMLSIGMLAIVVLLLTVTEEFRFLDVLFEAFSAFGTVGLTTGITSQLSVAGRLIIVATMFIGRLGPLTLGLSLIQRQKPTSYRYPTDNVRIG